MRKLFLICTSLISVITFNSNTTSLNNYQCRSYVVMDGYSGKILEGKDYSLKRSVASISKIMTAIIALESEKTFYVYTISEDVTGIEGSSIYLEVGEQYRLIDLVYGLLLRSGNDAAYAIAKFVSEDVSSFVSLMNIKAKEIGMNNTIFNNPCGLDIEDEGNISTAYDMSILMRYCMINNLFQEIISTKKYQFNNRVYFNKNKLLNTYDYYLGGKTGFTSKARRTLISASKKDEQYLIMCSLDCGSDYAFHKDVFERYYSKFRYIVFLYKGKNYIDEYVFESDNVIGLRIPSDKLKNAIKKYFINPITGTLVISIIDKDGNESYNETFYNIKCIKK